MTLTPSQGQILLRVARDAIETRLGGITKLPNYEAWMETPGASFVTLREHGELRGCMGSVTARNPLGEDVGKNAISAALEDSRFSPLQTSELSEIAIEVSVLSPLEELRFSSEADALAQLRPEIDGVVLDYPGHRALFLPQVWSTLPDPARFLGELKHKAHLSDRFWSEGIRLFRFTVQKFSEGEK